VADVKPLGIIALLLGLAAAAAAGYGLIETKPNYDYMSKSEDLGALGYALLSDYKGALMNQVMIAGGAGGLAVILGAVAFFKGRNKLGILGAVIGLVGAIIGVFVINPNF
jgi:hypothetical protein